jgi:hypothetical protein
MESSLTILGHDPWEKPDLKCRIATLFVTDRVLVTLPGIHATQRQAWIDLVEDRRKEAGVGPLSGDEYTALWNDAVDLIIEDGIAYIRPEPTKMDLAFAGDDLLQEKTSKQKIKFLLAYHPAVRRAVRRRGELWRIAPVPESTDDTKKLIRNSRTGIGGRAIYYYNKYTGTRFLTYQEFVGLGTYAESLLRQHLAEIRACAERVNTQKNSELRFFAADRTFSARDFAPHDFDAMPSDQLWSMFDHLKERFRKAVDPVFLHDDLDSAPWRHKMAAELVPPRRLLDEDVPEEDVLGLSAEFHLNVLWLPGARIEHDELCFDSVFDAAGCDPQLRALCHDIVRKMIFNFVREYGPLEYVNIGQVMEPMIRPGGGRVRPRPSGGRREVYLAELKFADRDQESLRVIRFMKYDVRHYLELGKKLEEAMILAEDYREWVLNRRLACRQLTMDVPRWIHDHKVREWYSLDPNRPDRGFPIWSTYFERAYVYGVASDKIPPHRFESLEYSLRFARLMGEAAATNLIVGRSHPSGYVYFDDGDEVIIEDKDHMPAEIVVADPTGAFNNFAGDLKDSLGNYASPIRSRIGRVPQPHSFLEAYLDGFLEKFQAIQQEYRTRQRIFHSFFRHEPEDERGNLSYRWRLILERLNQANPAEIAEIIRQQVKSDPEGRRVLV